MEFNELIAGFAARYGVAGLTAGERGLVALGIDDLRIFVQHLPEAERLVVYADLGAIPDAGAARFERTMLEANCLFQGTSGATLARHPETGGLFINRQESLRMLGVDGFCTLMEGFVDLARTWKGLLVEYTAKDGTAEPAPEVPPPEIQESGLDGFMRV